MRHIGIFTLLGAFFAAGCTEFEERPTVPGGTAGGDGPLVTTRVSLNVAPELDEQGRAIPLTRAFDELTGTEEDAIHNVWVFQFSEPTTAGDEDSRLLIRSTYIDDDEMDAAASTQEVEVDLIDSNGGMNLLVFVANINDGGYGWNMIPGKNTLGNLKTHNYRIRSNVAEDSRLWGDDWRNLIMSGSTETVVTEGVAVPGVSLERSLAKICLELTLDNPDYKIFSVQMRSVSDTFWFTDAINPPRTPDYSLATIMDYPIEKDMVNGLVDHGDTKRIVWYAAPNPRGANPKIQLAKYKNLYAPQGATHIEIVAQNINTGDGVMYRIYPGADITDFNILANHRYLIEQTIKGNGGVDSDDSRIEQYGNSSSSGSGGETLAGDANSFIINPPLLEGMRPRTFNIPITRVNAFWEPASVEYPGYGGLNEGAILSTDYWRVDLLWQDAAGMVRAAADPSRTDTQIYISKHIGYGPDDYFSITVPGGALHGNFVIALRELDPGSHPIVENRMATDVLWSWHFWVTDYNPDRKAQFSIEGDRFVYPVPGGQVERYGGYYWGYDTPGAASINSWGVASPNATNWNNYDYNPSSTQPYARSFIMDRTLGALSAGTTMPDSQSVLTYQFGRKDPFPGSRVLYDIEGVALTKEPKEGFSAQRWTLGANATHTDTRMKVVESVYDPMRFYYTRNPITNWASDVDGYSSLADGTNSYVWHDARVPVVTSSQYATGYSGKSIFDPCPKGWKIPTTYVWQDFRNDNAWGYRISTTEVHAKNDRDFVKASILRYWPYKEIDGKHPVEGNIVYPFSDYRGEYRTGDSTHPEYGAVQYGHYNSWNSYSYIGRLWSAVPYSTINGYSGYYTTNARSSFSTSGQYRYMGYRIRCVSMEE